LVHFNEFGHVSKVSLPKDFSVACITGFDSGTTPQAVVDALSSLGVNIDVNSVRIQGYGMPPETKAIVKVEDPLFASELCTKLKNSSSALNANPIPVDVNRFNYRKIFISWHKATRSVWLNFGNSDIANKVAARFNSKNYKCLGQPVGASTATTGSGRKSRDVFARGGFRHNPLAWTITLSDVPGNATTRDIEATIKLPHTRPRHIELGPVSFIASEAEVSVHVRSRLEKYGPLESFHLAPVSKGKRVKATAWFQDESDAKLACSLNKERLDILGKGKLTVTRIQSVKVKVSTPVYFALKSRVDEASRLWREQHLIFNVYPDALHRFTTLKIEGEIAKDVATARKALDNILGGDILMDDQNLVWDSMLSNNGMAYKKLKAIEEELQVVIVRDKSKCHLRFYGPINKIHRCARRVVDMLQEAQHTSYEIVLDPTQFSRMIRGGHGNIEKALWKSVAFINVVSKKLIINGTQEQYETALAIINGKHTAELRPSRDGPIAPEGDCPICFCQAENPIQTSCKHTYCQECFEECCKTAASTSTAEFKVVCQGDEGACSTVFMIQELKELLSTPVIDLMLKSSFEDYIQRNPNVFRYCPTPDCGYIYRSTTRSNPPGYNCSNCLEPLCTTCDARHGDYTCAEYKDIASGGYEALQKLKRKLNIKDCPNCSIPMEKTEGCNHMTCGGCKAHICWVCMAVFETGGLCYDHLGKKHGGIGLELEEFM
jgi:hypothetical protein